MKVGPVAVMVLLTAGNAVAGPVRVGVSETVYADIAHQIGDPDVAVTLLKAEKVASHGTMVFVPNDVVVCSGTRVDAAVCESARRATPTTVLIEAASGPANQRSDHASPWYDTRMVAGLARRLAEEFSRRLPTAAPHIAANLSRTQEGLRSIDRKSEEIAHLYQAAPVIVTDQLARDFVTPLRFRIQGETSARNAPRAGASSAGSLAALQDAIRRREGGILVYDQSTATPAIKDLVAAANDAGIPILGLRESLPDGLHYQQWMLRQLNALHGALNEAAP